jgi:PilZ domain
MQGQDTSTERRITGRVPVSVDAILYFNSLLLTDCRIRNLSSEGAFIVTGGQYIPDRALVDISLNVPAVGVPLRLTAQVMRSTEEGVGVQLKDVDANSMRQLIQTLYAA